MYWKSFQFYLSSKHSNSVTMTRLRSVSQNKCRPKRPLSFNFETICDSSNYFNLVNFDWQVKPSNRRLAQFRADISVILYVAHDMLLSLIPDLNTLFHPDPRNISARSIHQKCLTLLLAQVMIGAPMKNMDRYVEAQVAPQDNPGVPARLEPMQKVIFVHFRRVLLKLKLIMFYRMRLKNWHVGYIYPFLGFTVTLWNDWILLHSCLYWEESQLYNLVLIGLS